MTVETQVVDGATVRETATGVGTLRSRVEVNLAAERAGIVDAVPLTEGAAVESGHLLVRLDTAVLEQRQAAASAQVDQAQAQVRNLRWRFDRMQRLVAEGVGQAEEFKQLRDDLSGAEARLEQRRAQQRQLAEERADATTHAPRAGRVAQTHVDPGDRVAIGDPLVDLYVLDPLEVEFTLPSVVAPRVKPDLPVQLTIDGVTNRPRRGRISYLSPQVAPQSRRLTIKAEVANTDGRLRPGMFAKVTVVFAARENQPVVPEAALFTTRTGPALFVVEHRRAQRRQVETGVRREGQVEIRDGVTVGDEVVVRGHLKLSDGRQIRRAATSERAASSESTRAPTTQPAPAGSAPTRES